MTFLSYDKRTLCNSLNWKIELLNEERSGSGFAVDGLIEARKQVIIDNIKPDLDLFASYFNTEFIQKFKGYENTEIEFDILNYPKCKTDMETMSEWGKFSPINIKRT